MTKPLDIRPHDLAIVLQILQGCLPAHAKMWVFGSRAKWTTKDSSDLDLAIDAGRPLTRGEQAELAEAFEESDLPYTVDIADWHSISESFKEAVQADRVELLSTKKMISVGELCPFSYGKNLPEKSRIKTGNVPVYGSNGIIDWHDTPLTKGATIIIGRKGSVGKIHFSKKPCWAIDTTFFIEASEKNNICFLYYALQSLGLEGMNSDRAVPRLNRDNAHAQRLVAYSKAEQQAIAEVLSALDDKIELNRQMNDTLEETARALFKSWFVDFDPVRAKMAGEKPAGLEDDLAALFPDRLVDSPLGMIPEGWEVDEIGNMLDAIGGTTPSTAEPSYWEGGTVCWATPKDLSAISSHVLLDTERKVTEKGLLKISSGLLPAGTVLLSSRAPIGYLVVSEVPVAINQGCIAMKPKGIVGTQYILHWTIQNMESIKSRANGSTFQEISKKAFRSILALLPKKEVLIEFEKAAGALHNRVVENLRQNQRLSLIRDTLLPKLISGELRVGDISSIKEAV